MDDNNSKELTTLNTDFQEILAQANKNKGLKKITDPYLKTCRFFTVMADSIFKRTNKLFSGYVDKDGNQSSGAQGLSIQLSILFEKCYGFKITEAKTPLQMLEVTRARAYAEAMQQKCIRQNLSREWVKESIKRFLNDAANQFKEYCHE